MSVDTVAAKITRNTDRLKVTKENENGEVER
jgi:hypothetical protein